MIIISSWKSWQKNFKKKFTCLGENTEKYTIFTVSIEKEVRRINDNGEEIIKIYLTYYNLFLTQDS